ncbi:MAG: UDP-N-acetylmuramate dehydrogenase [Deltaproteobacteria bacterium]|nr:UDP-N-acetylmuramate dehydrogenase [Deltaproteobacteria bacterium]
MEYWGDPGRPSTPVLHHSNSIVMFAMSNERDDSPLARELRSLAGVKLKLAEPLARYASMKIGGPADYFIEVENSPALSAVLPLLRRFATPVCLLGNGSNVLISDRGVRGAVIHLAGEFKNIDWREEGEFIRVNVGAAYAVTQLVRAAARKGYAGLEFAEGIPGSVGGALVMNAGAYGSEFEKVVEQVDAVDAEGAEILFSREQLTFTYRDSHLPVGTVVTRVTLRLRKSETVEVSSKLRELVGKRKSSQPAGFPNSGSMFRNPPGDYAGRLIEAAGLKGKRVGQAQIAERHANFIVNLGGAKAQDVRQLMEMARAEVRKQFGVDLIAEVKLLGQWED